MTNKPKYVQIPTQAVVFFSLLLLVTSFFSGAYWFKNIGATGSITGSSKAPVFAAKKTAKPEFDFYVMSFCPYGNQIEDVIRPVADLLGDKANIQPRYIFDKITDLKTYCSSRSGDPTQCAAYVQSGYFTTEAECTKTIQASLDTCLDDKEYIKSSDGSYYASLHGRQEANQNIREICAWNQTEDKSIWWDFVGNVNKNCTDKNADNCWADQAQAAGLDTNKITECFNKEAVDLIENELSYTESNSVQGSPTLIVNGVNFPPESAYTQDGKGQLKVGKKVIDQADFRTPNTLKESICASFKNAPKECNTVLEALTETAPAAGGC